jgi:hypothetical protein
MELFVQSKILNLLNILYDFHLNKDFNLGFKTNKKQVKFNFIMILLKMFLSKLDQFKKVIKVRKHQNLMTITSITN